MLVLSRKEKQSILLADGLIKITVVQALSGRVRLGFEAPRDVSIIREELVTHEDEPQQQCNYRELAVT